MVDCFNQWEICFKKKHWKNPRFGPWVMELTCSWSCWLAFSKSLICFSRDFSISSADFLKYLRIETGGWKGKTWFEQQIQVMLVSNSPIPVIPQGHQGLQMVKSFSTRLEPPISVLFTFFSLSNPHFRVFSWLNHFQWVKLAYFNFHYRLITLS